MWGRHKRVSLQPLQSPQQSWLHTVAKWLPMCLQTWLHWPKVSEQFQCVWVSTLSEWRSVFCIQQLCNGIHLHMSACKCTFTLSIQKTIWSLYITAFIICVLKAYKLIAYILAIFRVMLGLIVKESCPVGSCPATMVVAVHSPKGGCVAPAIQVMVDPSASIAAMKAAPPSPARMEGCALKKQASHTFTASVPVAGQENGVSRTSCPTSLKYPYAL